MKAYSATVKPNSNAFAAIQRFDPEAVIELRDASEVAETYTITSEFDLFSLLDAAPGVDVWDEYTDTEDYDCDFPPDDPEPPNAPAKFQDWDCWYHPTLGFQQSKRTPKPLTEISDFALTVLMAGQDITDRVVAAAEWLRRYPEGPASRTGTKAWARGADEIALDLVGAQ